MTSINDITEFDKDVKYFICVSCDDRDDAYYENADFTYRTNLKLGDSDGDCYYDTFTAEQMNTSIGKEYLLLVYQICLLQGYYQLNKETQIHIEKRNK